MGPTLTTYSADHTAHEELPRIPAPRDPRCPLAPPASFTQWRDTGGPTLASWHDKPTWVLSRYEDIRAGLTDPRLSADIISGHMRTDSPDEAIPQVFARMDDPEHNRIRRMMVSDFTNRRVESMRPAIEAQVDRFLDAMIDAGPPADLVRSFALPVPSLVISILLGVPWEDVEIFQKHSATGLDSRLSAEERGAAAGAMFSYMVDLVARKEREPGDDLISRQITEHVASGAITRETVAINGMIMLQAGHETTASMISLGTLVLLENPEQMRRLRETEDPAVAAGIVDELLRYLTVVHSLVERRATEDMTLAGTRIRAGDMVLMNLPAGNWDPTFAPDPGTIDTDRGARGHLAFGYGAHQCIGANLARAELQIALTALVRRLPGLRLAVPFGDLVFENEKEIYGVAEMPVAW